MLGVISGYAELLEEELTEQPTLAGYAHQIYHAGERGARLTKKLLAFSRNKASEADVLNLNTLLRDQQHMLEKTLTVRIKLVLNLAKNLWPVWIDGGDMEDALLNMSINAMHAIEGNGQLTIQTRNEKISELEAKQLGLDAGDYVALTITDTGCGMDESTKERIFDPFYSTKGDKGTGLGLSQVYGFVERSDGAIKVYSELGQGTRFVFFLPRHCAGRQDYESKQMDSAVDMSGSETILIVDDELALLDLTCNMLEQKNYRVFCAKSAKQALNILEQESIDLLFSDVVMPGMNGYQLVSIVQEKYPTVKIQLASGFSDDHHADMIDVSLQENLLHKPFSSQSLLKKIRELLDEKYS